MVVRPVTLPRKAVVTGLIAVIFLALLVGGAGKAAAIQNGPQWSTGNYWQYRASSGSTTNWSVAGTSTVTLGSTSYPVWHVIQNTTSSGGLKVRFDNFLTQDGLKTAKANGTIPFLGSVAFTLDPPQPTAVFPLSVGERWSGNTTVTTVTIFGTGTTIQAYGATVTGESSVTVAAGTFTAAVIRSPSAGAPYTLSFYSDSAGWLVRTESYDASGTRTGSEDLTSYNYTPPSFLGGNLFGLPILIWILLAVILVVAVVGAAFLRRRPPMVPQPTPPQPGMPPVQPPPYEQPPTGPPGPPSSPP